MLDRDSVTQTSTAAGRGVTDNDDDVRGLGVVTGWGPGLARVSEWILCFSTSAFPGQALLAANSRQVNLSPG